MLRGRRRRGRDRPAGGELAFEQVPQSRARRRRAADPASERLQDRRPHGAGAHSATTSCTSFSRGYGYKPYFVAGDEPEVMHQQMARTLDAVLDEIRSIQHDARSNGFRERPHLADDRAAYSEGLDRPEDRRRQAGRGHIPRAPGAARRGASPIRTTCTCSSSGCGAIVPRSCSTPTAGWWPRSPRSRPRATGAWARTRMPTAACCCGTCALPDFRDYAVAVPAPGAVQAEATRVSGAVPARRDAAERREPELPRDGPGRDRVEPAGRIVRSDRSQFRRRASCRRTTTCRRTAA